MTIHRVEDSPQIDTTSLNDQPNFGTIPGLVWAFRIHGDGTAEPLFADKPIENHFEGWVWIHLDLASTLATQWLAASGLPKAGIATMLSRDRHQQLHATGSFIHGVIADLERDLGGVRDCIGHLRFVMTDRYLVSGRHRHLSAVEAARIAIESGTHRLPHAASLLELIVEQVADGIDQVADSMADELDGIENQIAEGSGPERSKLARLRRGTVQMHRQLSGLRAIFHRLERRCSEDLKPGLQLAASRLAQRLDELDHSVLKLRERGGRLQEEMSIMMAEETNRHLYVLTTLTTLLLPATLVTGVFGMNTKALPLTETDSGFLIAMGLVFGASVAVYLLMRRIGVFRL
ncbi:CorA family divalent cation transporter [Nitrobacter sp. TKz-YC01]|uniref:CorA family divalent cation transporter n=1 Tax=Nitrobacter sp. TKz-YC01 TaxID=3398703 RepID=UPI003A0FD896